MQAVKKTQPNGKRTPTKMPETKIVNASDFKILEILKKHKQTIFDAKVSSHGLEKWFQKMEDDDDFYEDNSPEEVFMKQDIFNRLRLLFSKLVYETKLTVGCDEVYSKYAHVEHKNEPLN